MILDFGRHCWRLLVCVVNPAEIKVENEQCNRVLVILNFLAETHCQARITAIEQAHTQIGALNMAGAD